MKKYFYLFSLLLAGLVMTSCSESEEVVEEFPDWQLTNETYFNSLYTTAQQKIAAGDNTWKVIRSFSIPKDTTFLDGSAFTTDPTDYIVAEVLNEGTGSGCPLYTDYVRCHYQGRLLPSTSYATGYVFDQSWYGTFSNETSVPSSFQVSGLVDGFATALQNMHIGDKWRVYIPYQLGYGSSSSSSSIPDYSTLIFDITLVQYYRADADVPDYN